MAIGIDGKEKPVFAEGDEVIMRLPGIGEWRGKIRGRTTEDIIDLWIVEFVDGSPNPEHYHYSCGVVPHLYLTPNPEST